MQSTKPTRSRRRRRFWAIGAAALVAFSAVVYFGGAYVAARAAVSAPNQGRKIEAPTQATDFGDLLSVSVGPPDARLVLCVLNPSRNLTADGSPAGTILLLHGVRGNKNHMLGMGNQLASRGYRAVAVDLRGHGESSGDWLTFGVQESRDLSQVLDFLAEQGLLQGRVGVFGASYGGATAVMLAGRDHRVDAVVCVAGFSAFCDVLPGYVRRYLPLGPLLTDMWIDTVTRQAGRIAGFDPCDASPMEAITQTQAQILLIHGLCDEHIPSSHSDLVYQAAPSHSRLVLIPGENHETIMADRSGVMTRETLAWFDHWLSTPPADEPP